MNKRFLKNILILLLVSVLAVVLFRYISYLRENIRSLEGQKQNLLQELEKEKSTVEEFKLRNNSLKGNLKAVHKRLNKSFLALSQLKGNLKAAHKRLNKSFLALSESEKRTEELNSQADILKAENNALSEERTKLAQDNEVLKFKLASITELKKAIQELKRLARLEGNRGFLIKDGQSTFIAKVKIEVTPASGR